MSLETAAPPLPINKTPGVCGGRACIRWTRIPVWLLVQYRHSGLGDDRLLYNYPSLTPADLAATWDYYRQHTAEIDADIADQERDD